MGELVDEITMLVKLLANGRILHDLLQCYPLIKWYSQHIFSIPDVLFGMDVSVERVFPPWLAFIHNSSFIYHIFIEIIKIVAFRMVSWQQLIQPLGLIDIFEQIRHVYKLIRCILQSLLEDLDCLSVFELVV